jgi:hypothetical protein
MRGFAQANKLIWTLVAFAFPVALAWHFVGMVL